MRYCFGPNEDCFIDADDFDPEEYDSFINEWGDDDLTDEEWQAFFANMMATENML